MFNVKRSSNMVSGDQQPDTNMAFYYHWKVWHWMGIKARKQSNLKVYRIYAVLINFVVTFLFPLTLIVNVFFAQNTQQLCENLTITITDTIANLKFLNVYLVREDLERIKAILGKLDRRAENLKEKRILQDAIRISQLSFLIFVRLYTVGTGLSILKVILAQERCLLYSAWFGVNWFDNTFIYVIVMIYQLFGLIVQALQNCANDSYPPAYLIILTAQMKALEVRVRAIGRRESDGEHLWLTKEQRLRNLHEFNACIKDYNNILKLFTIIENIISKACLAQFVCSALVQCTVGLHFLYVVDAADYSAQILSIIFFVAVTLEVFIICYFGHCMSTQSWNLTYAFYSCGWLSQKPGFKKNLLITLMRTQRHSIVYAGSYIPVDLPTFVQLMKYAYSTFTLLMRFK
ncbi:odorant receptor 2a [Lucilia cuprina]|uniref:odorant receptor 2a n=1 Tax=Lucilia cuprina TaxID=7375 RepID=UPI001F05069A|nr:odorant receptor 2a [Lucilia cuprina]